MGKRCIDKRTLRTKQLIRVSLVKLIQSKDISNVSVKEIAENANINRKTFYLHYADVASVLNDIEQRILDQIQPIVEEIDIDDLLLDAFPMLKQITTILVEDEMNNDYMMKSDCYNHLFSKIKELLINILAKKYIDKYQDQSKYIYPCLVFEISACVEVFHQWVVLKEKSNFTLEELCRTLAALMRNGFASGIQLAKIKDEADKK